ncbi:MAG: DNA repair protein RecO [Thermodesulfobacteriota bacterium]
MPGFTTSAILLRRIDHGDYDLIISFLTRLRGKVSVMAKNAKKSRKRFSGLLEPFSELEVVCWTVRNAGMPILQEAAMQSPFANIRGNVAKTAYAAYWTELTHGWLEDLKPQPLIYDLLHYCLNAIDKDLQAAEVVSIIFQVRFIRLTGFSPELKNCQLCGRSLDRMPGNAVILELEKGGIVCHGCSPGENRYRLAMSKGSIKQLAWMRDYDIPAVERLRLTPKSTREALRAMESFVPYHLGRVPRSLVFLNQMRKE